MKKRVAKKVCDNHCDLNYKKQTIKEAFHTYYYKCDKRLVAVLIEEVMKMKKDSNYEIAS